MGFITELLIETVLEGSWNVLSPEGNAGVLRNCARKEVRRLWNGFLRSYPVPFAHPGVIAEEHFVDFHCENANLAIEIVSSRQSEPKTKKQIKREKAFRAKNLTVLRISTKEIDQNFFGVCDVIDRAVKGGIAAK